MSAIRVKFVSKKISKVKWKPQSTSVFVTGSWDDTANKICVWSYPNINSTPKDNNSLDVTDPQIITEVPFSGSVTDLKVVTNDLVFASSTLGVVAIYKLNDQKLRHHHSCDNEHRFADSPAVITGIAVKGTDVASVGEDGRLSVFNFNKLTKTRLIESSDQCSFSAISYLRHQEVIAGNVLGYLKVWDLRMSSDQPVHTLMISGEQVGVTSICSHPTQPHVFGTGHDDGTLCIWDLRQDRKPTTLLSGHSAAVSDLLFHPENPDYLYTCSMDGSVWQWNASALRSGTTDQEHNVATGNPWLSCDASKHRLDITSLFPQNTICVNCMDLNSTTLLWGTDSEALYILSDIIV